MLVLNPENYFISRGRRLFGQITKQLSNNFEPQKPWKCKQLSAMRPDPGCF